MSDPQGLGSQSVKDLGSRRPLFPGRVPQEGVTLRRRRQKLRSPCRGRARPRWRDDCGTPGVGGSRTAFEGNGRGGGRGADVGIVKDGAFGGLTPGGSLRIDYAKTRRLFLIVRCSTAAAR